MLEKTAVVKEIQDILPRNSIGKYDLLAVFAHEPVFAKVVKLLSQDFLHRVDYVVAPEAIGWILGAAMAKELGVGFVGVRKGSKLPYAEEELISTHFTDYSDQQKSFDLPKNSIVRGKRVLIVDDWIETGSQVRALMTLLGNLECQIVGIATIGIDTNDVTQGWIDSGFVAYIGTNI